MDTIGTITHILPWSAWLALGALVLAVAARFRKQVRTTHAGSKTTP